MMGFRDFHLQYQFEITNKLGSMEYADFYEQMRELKNEELKVKSKIFDLKRKYISELPFKVGDKINVRGQIGWLKELKMRDCNRFDVCFYPPKKNGEKSNRYFCAWFIELEDISLIS